MIVVLAVDLIKNLVAAQRVHACLLFGDAAMLVDTLMICVGTVSVLYSERSSSLLSRCIDEKMMMMMMHTIRKY